MTRTPSLHNYCLKSSDDQLATGRSATGDTEATAAAGSVDKPTRSAAGRVGFDDEAGLQPTSTNRYTSPLTRDIDHADSSYCPDDYDNTASDDDDRGQTEINRHHIVRSRDLPDDKSSQHASAPATSATVPRATIKSSEEESLDNLVAHLLGAVTPPIPRHSTTSDGQPTSSDTETSSSLRWPQGDSLPRVVMRKTGGVRDYDVPRGKLMNEELLADENDNVKNVIYDLPASQVSAPADLPHSPPLLTIRKKATSTTNSGLTVTSTDCRTPAELVSNLNVAPRSDCDRNERDQSLLSNHAADHRLHSDGEMTSSPFTLTAQQLSYTESLRDESRRRQNESKPDETRGDDALVSMMCADVQRTSLLDQFKVLRLQVLTSTSQLLGCVSGTWKRGESFRSKLTTIMQLCLALKTSVGRLEAFLQSALSSAVQFAANSPLVDTANTRIKNLQAVQTSIDAYIETLDGENLSGIASKSDLKVGGIIHLTKEIPGLVRTFAPVVEYLAVTSQPSSNAPLATPQEFDAQSDRTEGHRQNTVEMHLDRETRQLKDHQETTYHQYDAKQNLTQHSADVSLITREPEPVQYLQTQNEQGTYPDVYPADIQQVQMTIISTNTDDKAVIPQSSQTSSEQRSYSVISGSVQQVETTPTTTHSDVASVVSRDDVKNTMIVLDSEMDDVDHDEVSDRKSQEPVIPVLPVKVEKIETAAPPTPPPKLRVASLYHASLGITNSLTTAPSALATSAVTTTTTTTTGRCDEADIATTCNLAARLPAEERTAPLEIVSASDDKFQQTYWQTDDRIGGSSEVRTVPEINYVTGFDEDIVSAAGGRTHYRFPRATETSSSSEQPAVVLRRPAAEQADLDLDAQQCRVSESELETPDFRASGVSQTMVDQLEALQRQANAQAVITHTDTTAGYDLFDTEATRSLNPHYQSTLSAEDRRLLMFYCDQMTGHWNVLDQAASAFFHCMDRRQPPKVFVSHSKFVIVAGHKMAYLGDVLARNIEDNNAQDWVVAHSNRLCSSLKTAVRATKEAALAYPAVPDQQQMVDCIKEVTDWAIELKELVDRLAYIGRPDHVLA